LTLGLLLPSLRPEGFGRNAIGEIMKKLASYGSFLAVFGLSVASAQTVYDLPSKEAPVMVHDKSGIIFLGKDAQVYRAFSWNAPRGAETFDLLVTDLDRDGKPNIIGAGKPTFVLNHDGDPMWYLDKGCDQVIVQDIAADPKLDVMCLLGTELSIYTHDGQLIWRAKLTQRLEECKAADINGDLKADIECKIRGTKKYTRFDGANGQVLAASTDAPEIEETVYTRTVPVEATEEGTMLKKDLTGDGKQETITVSAKEITVSGEAGAKKFSTNAKSYKRSPVAELKSVMANGFEDTNAAQKVVNDLNDKLASCYAAQVRRNQFAGQGDVLMEVKVDDKGKATNVNLLHSGLADASVAKCATGLLEKAKYPASTGSGSINIRMFYTFKDR